jgi:pyruvate/2-oxoglutarate dehydrogenase complex dihydrolipoamide acyltransferase (E2) component
VAWVLTVWPAFCSVRRKDALVNKQRRSVGRPTEINSGVAKSLGSESFQTRPFLKIRKAYLDVLAAGRRKNIIHGLIEVDVTEARRVLRQRDAAGDHLSFTAFLMHAVARAVDEDRILHAYRRRNQLILFDEVDVNTQIEVELADQKIVKSLLVRSANRKSVAELSTEIDGGLTTDPASERRYRGTLAFLSVPRPVRSLAWRAVMANPHWIKRFGGTVGMSSIGMFGPSGGWGIPIAPPTLMVTVGGIATKPRYVNGTLEPRELLDITISVDHDIVDGAPAARFARRLAELAERADALR